MEIVAGVQEYDVAANWKLMVENSVDSFRIKERRVLIDAHELGTLGSVSFIL